MIKQRSNIVHESSCSTHVRFIRTRSNFICKSENVRAYACTYVCISIDGLCSGGMKISRAASVASCSVRTHERGISINANKCSTYYNVGERSVGGKVIMPDGYQLGRTRDAEQVYMQRNDIIGNCKHQFRILQLYNICIHKLITFVTLLHLITPQ